MLHSKTGFIPATDKILQGCQEIWVTVLWPHDTTNLQKYFEEELGICLEYERLLRDGNVRKGIDQVSASKCVPKTGGYICLLSKGQLIQVENTIIFSVCSEIKLFCKELSGKMPFFECNCPHLKINLIQSVVILFWCLCLYLWSSSRASNWHSWHKLEAVRGTPGT